MKRFPNPFNLLFSSMAEIANPKHLSVTFDHKTAESRVQLAASEACSKLQVLCFPATFHPNHKFKDS